MIPHADVRYVEGRPGPGAPRLTRHGAARAAQRGVNGETLAALIAWADVEAPVGGGCTALRLSRRRLADRDLRAALGPCADRLSALAVVLSDDTGEVVTVLHPRAGAAGRRYRRAH